MRFLAVLIGILSVHCTFGTQCQEPTKARDDCMKIIDPTHGELFENPPYRPQHCMEGTLLQAVRDQLDERLYSNQQRVGDLLNRLDDISIDHTRKILSADSSVKQRFIALYTSMENATFGVHQCANKPHASCEEIQACCSAVNSKLYAQSSVSLETISSFLTELKTEFGKVCNSTMNSIRDVQRDANSTLVFI
ncbi:hypothetical protein PPYR_11245 [Photinus pyralis]|uniref:Protein TsetseEP domain-containing protein n=1 Tax=Photinus pyralis TaxID=7054 RepID=A0A1Y1K5J3_PHOPY|nr:uncharacterized protein LOC116176563 [Photinus pyralis]KAB0794406.1 hypothetical protein PPYR_11245 [Photinus pyralis]